MEYRFIQPVSMRVTIEQYERDLRVPLLKMGYKEYAINLYNEELNYLITNHANNNDSLTNLGEENINHNARHFIPDYNPELFLAIAAMTDKESPIVGEWLVCTDEMAYVISGYKVGEFVKNGNPNIELNWFRRATLQELINKFTNQKQDNMKKELTQEQFEELKNLIAPENVDKFDKLMGIEKPAFKKEDFVTGDKVILRNGTTYLVIRDCNAGEYGRQIFTLLECKLSGEFTISDNYNENLCSKSGYKIFDIMKIYRYKDGRINSRSMSARIDEYALIWER